jgi:putative inorganic carbon (HCO3(-)) transporter
MPHLGLEGYLPMLLYVGGIVACLLSLFWRPHIGLYYLVPLIPLQTVRYRLHAWPAGRSVIDIVLLAVILGLYFHNHGRVFVSTAMNRLLIVFIVFHYITLWRGAFFLDCPLPISISDPRFSDWKNYVEMPLIFFVTAAAIKTSKQMKILILLICFSVLMINRAFYSTTKDRDFSHFSYEVRYAGALGYAGENGLAAFEAQFALFVLGLYAFEKRRYVKIGMLGLIASCIYCLLFSFSRGGYLGFLVGLMFVGFVKKRSLLVLALVLLVGWQTLTPTAVQERLAMTYESGEGLDNSSGERMALWQDAIKVVAQNPITGTGFDTYAFMGRVGGFRDTHNFYLKVLVEGGVIGLLLLLWLLARAFNLGHSLFQVRQDPFLASLGLGFAAMMVSAIVVNVFGDRFTYQQVNGQLWVLMGCVARGLLIREEAQQQPGAEAEAGEIHETDALEPVALS